MHCRPIEPFKLWEKYKTDLSDDFRRQLGAEEAERVAYRRIADHLEEMGSPITEFPGMPPVLQVDWSLENIDIAAEVFEAHALYELLKDPQRNFVDRVVEVLEIGDGSVARVFYLNGHAGTGKSFTYRYRCTVV